MEQMWFLKVFRDRNALLVLIAVVVFASAPACLKAQSHGLTRQEVSRRIADNWIKVATKQYDRGFYGQAEQSCLRAEEYEKHLTADQQKKLTKLLAKARAATQEREVVLKNIQAADELIKQRQLVEALAGLENAVGSEFLTKAERQAVEARIKLISSRIDELEKLNEQIKNIIELYGQSEVLYHEGEYEKAREGFVEIAGNSALLPAEAKTAEEYMAKIDDILAQWAATGEAAETPAAKTGAAETTTAEAKEESAQDQSEAIQKQNESVLIEVAGPATDEVEIGEGPDHKTSILQSYTKAIVTDAAAKAQEYISRGEYIQAEQIIEAAEHTLLKNRQAIGEGSFTQYADQLQLLAEQLAWAKDQQALQQQQHQQLAAEAQKAQQQYTEIQRQYIEAEAKSKITQLMSRADACLQQNSFKDAAEQLRKALAEIAKLTSSYQQ